MSEVIDAIEGKVLPDDTMVHACGKSGYYTCSGHNSKSKGDSGMTADAYYLICDIPGHCANATKLAVTITIGARRREAPSLPAPPGDPSCRR